MSPLWLNFTIVILVQLVAFLVHAWYEKRFREVPRILLHGALIGVPFGIAFDLVIGRTIGLYEYGLGFTFPFLIINGALSYGFMQANVLLMEKARFLHFCVWSLSVCIVYEITNHFFRVWNWEFGPRYVEMVVIPVGYIGVALLMALVWHFIFRHRFAFITRILT